MIHFDDGFLAINGYAKGLRGLIGRVCMEFAIYKNELYRYSIRSDGSKGLYVKKRDFPKDLDRIEETISGKRALIDEYDERITDIFTSKIYYRYDEPQLGEEGYKGFFVVGNASGKMVTGWYFNNAEKVWYLYNYSGAMMLFMDSIVQKECLYLTSLRINGKHG